MSTSEFQQMMRYVGFTEADAGRLRKLLPVLRPHFLGLVSDFYAVLLSDPEAKAVLETTESRVERLHESLYRWLEGLFSGRYDQDYFLERCQIGRTHVRVHLPQRYMFTAMNVIRLGLIHRLGLVDPPVDAEAVASLHKLLDLELAIMNETYREDLIQKMREIEQRHFEQRLSESEHLANIGQLAASLAHEIKNPLAGISGAIQVLAASLAPKHPHQEVIEEVLKQIDRLDAAVRDLLVYARPKPPERSRVNLSRTLDRTMVLFREEPSFKRIQLVCLGLDTDHVADVDETQIQQVVTNLLLNAAHACEEGGQIVCEINGTPDQVQISVKDNGAGIPAEVLPRVFEPFFTTKARGTGLGLSICRRIIEVHGGRLELISRPEQGTKVVITLRRTI